MTLQADVVVVQAFTPVNRTADRSEEVELTSLSLNVCTDRGPSQHRTNHNEDSFLVSPSVTKYRRGIRPLQENIKKISWLARDVSSPFKRPTGAEPSCPRPKARH